MGDFFLSVTGAGDKSGQPYTNAFSYAEFDAWAGANAPGDICYVESGGYTPNSDPGQDDGTVAAPIPLIGVTDLANPTTTEATGDDRPYFDYSATANTRLLLDNYWMIRNLRVKSDNAATGAIRADTGGMIINCDAENIGAGYGIHTNALYTLIARCTAKSAGAAIKTGIDATVVDTTLYDSAIGLQLGGANAQLIGCTVYGCTTAVDLADFDYAVLMYNTLYNGTTGITSPNSQHCRFMYNIISDFTTAANWTGAEEKSNFWDWNCWWDAITATNVTKGPNAITTVNPAFVDAAGDDFRVQAAELLNVGLNGAAIGAVQTRFGPMRHPGTAGGANA